MLDSLCTQCFEGGGRRCGRTWAIRKGDRDELGEVGSPPRLALPGLRVTQGKDRVRGEAKERARGWDELTRAHREHPQLRWTGVLAVFLAFQTRSSLLFSNLRG